jgi:imidazolonepropionase-like amidohydrolase
MKKTRIILAFLMTLALVSLLVTQVHAEEKESPSQVLITNVDVWDGTSDAVMKGTDVLVEGNLIKKAGKSIKADGAQVFDGKGKTLMPGLIEAHAHLSLHGDLFQIRRSD